MTDKHTHNQGATAVQQLQIPPLSEGEIYIGAIGDKNGDVHHVILMPGDNGEATFADALQWAKSIGGDLPTKTEQSMLWEGHRDQFKKKLYWSNETHHEHSGYAWVQYFDHGNQSGHPKDRELRARAVRRLVVERRV